MARAKAEAEAVVEEKSEVVEEPGIPQEIKDAFLAAHGAGKDEDLIKIDMIAAGAKFKQVTRMYNDLMVENGFAVSKEEKEDIIAKAIADVDLSTEEGFNAAVEAVNNAIDSTNDKGAATMVRAYAKKKEVEFYKKPKSEGGGNRTTFITDYYNALVENPNMTEEEAHKFIAENGTQNTIRWEKAHQKVRALVNSVAAKYVA